MSKRLRYPDMFINDKLKAEKASKRSLNHIYKHIVRNGKNKYVQINLILVKMNKYILKDKKKK